MNDERINLSWSQFESINPDKERAFENMCRMLFNQNFFDNKEIFHSEPNNPGIEIVPVLNSSTGKKISFQSKYMSVNDYSQIKQSAVTTIKYYKDELDELYLYTNKDLTTTSKSYIEIRDLLEVNGIELILISNQTILDQVLISPVISSYFFRHHSISKIWIESQLKLSLDSLGPRFNDQFNVVTKTENHLDLFTLNEKAVIEINNKKNIALEKVENLLYRNTNHNNYLNKVKIMINSLEEIQKNNNIEICFNWVSILKKKLSEDIGLFEKKLKDNQKQLNHLYKINEIPNKFNEGISKKIANLELENGQIQKLLNIPNILEISPFERKLITSKMLFVKGEAGMGKSQLFANISEKNTKLGNYSVLLLGHTFLTDDYLFEQITSKLELEQNFDTFLNILESIGEQNNKAITIFFDAINESDNKNIWKNNINTLYNKILNYRFIKIAFSFRNGYENTLLDESIKFKIEKDDIFILEHFGFRNESIEATKQFLNHYGIPFSPASFLQYEITNPLFLTLLCKTYSGEEINMFSLFDKVVENADAEIQKALNLDGSIKILNYLIDDLLDYKLEKSRRSLTKQEIFQLSFWEIYGLNTSKLAFLSALEKTGLFFNSIDDGIERYYLNYNLLEDYFSAKLIMKKYTSKQDLLAYIEEKLLKINNQKEINYSDIDIFTIISIFFAEKFHEECMYLIDYLEDEYIKEDIMSRHVKSFSLRKPESIDKFYFKGLSNNNLVNIDDMWSVFIENSTRIEHPLNAIFLSEILFNLPLVERDYLWTTYINDVANEQERLYQLVILFYSGDTITGLNKNNIMLLLILFSWLLTSSNRDLRDNTSKAMSHLFKNNFELCKLTLEQFQYVDDPYISQRLFGAVLGACTIQKQESKTEFKELAEYIYLTIFDNDKVVPDILLRDYAKLTIEKFLNDFPNEVSNINRLKITPPYNSIAIPVVDEEEYNLDNNEGFERIVISMTPSGIDSPFMYGDFGRYVFQSALSNFKDIDITNLYHYSIQYIRDELNYSEKLLGEYDRSIHHPFNRDNRDKFERIGKKYQWITMYNILARVSDTHQLEGDYDREDYAYKGSFDPYVRDYDPTLNLIEESRFDDIPTFKEREKDEGIFNANLEEDENLIFHWVEEENSFFTEHARKFIFIDEDDEEWILLNQYEELKYGDKKIFDSSEKEQRVWSMSHSYIVKENEFLAFKEDLQNKNFMGRWFPENKSSYTLFNREYPWSDNCNEVFKNYWVPYEVKTNETFTVEHKGTIPEIIYTLDNEGNEVPEFSFTEKTWETQESKRRLIGHFMPTYIELTWEEEYDFSLKDSHVQYLFPTKMIYNELKLQQNIKHGLYYNSSNKLIAFDGRISGIASGLLIRKKYLLSFLRNHKLKLFWTCLGEKQYLFGHRSQIWSEWSGFFYLDDTEVKGSLNYIKIKK